ncbi:MAG: D-alanyl-D-alanine carboxypeptidase [Proteobacteria bacterium]|nr:D-alanyl-D-alanine carboxypeptidase [Pseudomonadota bacterium]
MPLPLRSILLACACALAANAGAAPAVPADAMPPALIATLRGSGVPLKNFGIAIRPVDAAAPTMTLNGDEPFLMASTTKVVTSLAALDLLGPTYLLHTDAYSTAPVGNGRLTGDLVISGGRTGLTVDGLRRWFKQMRSEGLAQVHGQIVLDRFSLLYEQHPAQVATTLAEAAPGPDPRTYNRDAIVVSVEPGRGDKATVMLAPRPRDIDVDNDVLMGGGTCGAVARWRSTTGAPPRLSVSGRWDASCGRQEIAFMKRPDAAARAAAPAASAPRVEEIPVTRMVASLWAESGGRLSGRVVESGRREPVRAEPARPAWSSRITTSLPELIREMNKTSNNTAARNLLLALAPARSDGKLSQAQGRVQAWLLGQGLADGDIRIDEGSGQSRLERGKARALVQLLCNEWRAPGSQAFIASLPIAGVDGTLAGRMRKGAATGHAFLKTGTLSDTRALAGYVVASSGRVYAVSMMVNHPQAARATPALDAMVEWLAKNG